MMLLSILGSRVYRRLYIRTACGVLGSTGCRESQANEIYDAIDGGAMVAMGEDSSCPRCEGGRSTDRGIPGFAPGHGPERMHRQAPPSSCIIIVVVLCGVDHMTLLSVATSYMCGCLNISSPWMVLSCTSSLHIRAFSLRRRQAKLELAMHIRM